MIANQYISWPIFLFGLSLIAGCQMFGPTEDPTGWESEYIMECEQVSDIRPTIKRCVNDEVICYKSYDGLSCMRNEKK